MAEAVARREASDVIEPCSAGLYPLGHIAELTEETLLANGYSIDELSSKPIHKEALRDADVVVNISGLTFDPFHDGGLARRASAPCENRPNVEEWDVADPYGEEPPAYQKTLEEIERRVCELASRLRAENRSSHR